MVYAPNPTNTIAVSYDDVCLCDPASAKSFIPIDPNAVDYDLWLDISQFLITTGLTLRQMSATLIVGDNVLQITAQIKNPTALGIVLSRGTKGYSYAVKFGMLLSNTSWYYYSAAILITTVDLIAPPNAHISSNGATLVFGGKKLPATFGAS
jgi:hypothetical protein